MLSWNLLRISTTTFLKNTSGWLLLFFATRKYGGVLFNGQTWTELIFRRKKMYLVALLYNEKVIPFNQITGQTKVIQEDYFSFSEPTQPLYLSLKRSERYPQVVLTRMSFHSLEWKCSDIFPSQWWASCGNNRQIQKDGSYC